MVYVAADGGIDELGLARFGLGQALQVRGLLSLDRPYQLLNISDRTTSKLTSEISPPLVGTELA